MYLEINQKNSMWIVGFFSSAIYAVVFYNSKFYAGMSLNAYYVAASIYGWYCWRYAAGRDETGEGLPESRITWKRAGILLAVSVVLFAAGGYALDNRTDSPVPYYDALAATLSIVATWMLAKKILEQWYVWIFVNFFSAGLYFWQGLYPTSALFIVYGVISVAGLIKWRRTIDR